MGPNIMNARFTAYEMMDLLFLVTPKTGAFVPLEAQNHPPLAEGKTP
jgi:hypothetical protein